MAGQALVAAGRTVRRDRRGALAARLLPAPRRPAVPIVYEVERMRDGRSFTTRRVVAVQHGRADLHPVGVVPAAEDGLEPPGPMPDVPDPDDAARPRRAARRRRRRCATGRPESAAARHPLRRRAAVVGRRGAADRRPAQRVWIRADGDAARRPAAARLRAHLRQRPDPARLGAGPARPAVRRPVQMASASTTPCGSTARSAPTSGCSTTRSRRRPPAPAGWPPAGCSPEDGALVASVVQEGLVRLSR